MHSLSLSLISIATLALFAAAPSSLIQGANAHAAIIGARGLNNIQGRALGVDPNLPRNGETVVPFQQDSAIMKDNEIAAGGSPCGRTLQRGNIAIEPAMTALLQEFGAFPLVAPGQPMTLVLHQVNADGAGPYTCQISPSANGRDFVNIPVLTNVPGVNGINAATGKTAHNMVVQIPDGVQCTGGSNKNACLVRCRNPVVGAGTFGGCVPVQMQAPAPLQPPTEEQQLVTNPYRPYPPPGQGKKQQQPPAATPSPAPQPAHPSSRPAPQPTQTAQPQHPGQQQPPVAQPTRAAQPQHPGQQQPTRPDQPQHPQPTPQQPAPQPPVQKHPQPPAQQHPQPPAQQRPQHPQPAPAPQPPRNKHEERRRQKEERRRQHEEHKRQKQEEHRRRKEENTRRKHEERNRRWEEYRRRVMEHVRRMQEAHRKTQEAHKHRRRQSHY